MQTLMCLYSQEVGSLIRDALEQRVRQFQEARYQKIQPKPRKDFTLTAPLCLEGLFQKAPNRILSSRYLLCDH